MSLTESELDTAALEDSVQDHENDTFPTTSKEDSEKNKFKVELLEFVNVIPKETKYNDESNLKSGKRKRGGEEEEDEDTKDLLTGIYLRTMYPLAKAVDKTVTIGIFKSLNFQPAVLLNHCSKSSILFSIDAWDNFAKSSNIIQSFLQNNLSGKRTSVVLHESDIEVDIIRLRGFQLVRIRNLTTHNKKILLSNYEFYVLFNLVPVITRYIHQLVAYENLVTNYLKAAVLNVPPPQLIYGSLDTSFYNRLTHEIECYRGIDQLSSSIRSYKKDENVTTEGPAKIEIKDDRNEES